MLEKFVMYVRNILLRGPVDTAMEQMFFAVIMAIEIVR